MVILSGKGMISLGPPSTNGGGDDAGLTSMTLSVECGNGNDEESLMAVILVEVNGAPSTSMFMSLSVLLSLSIGCCWLLTERCISGEVEEASAEA